MSDVFKYMKLVSYFMPIVRAVVQLIEDWGKGISGSEKKTRALSLIEAIWNGLSTGDTVDIKEIRGVPFELFAPVLSFLIDTIVAIANLAGIFTHASSE